MEQLLHYCWKHRLFPAKELATTLGQTIEIIDTGLHNHHAGPDFMNAKIKVDGNMVWAGNIEIHQRSTDWYAHHHQTDEAYNNVILHVSGVVDGDVVTQSGRTVPQVQLSIPANVLKNYRQLIAEDAYPPCYRVIGTLPKIVMSSWISALQTQRLEQKTNAITQRLQLCEGDWERVLFVTLARNFGFGVNGEAFEQWAMAVDLRSIDHHRDDLFQIEALFLGQAGLLCADKIPQKYHETMVGEGYFEKIKNEYQYLSHKFGLQSIDAKLWKFLRLRPQNFPHIRLAQLAFLYHSRRLSMGCLVECTTIDQLKAMLQTQVTPYWETHYQFGSVSKHSEKQISKASIEVLLINTIVPVLFAYGRYKGLETLCERAIGFLEQLKPEQNHIVTMWQNCGLVVQNAADTQALVQLKKHYCDRKDCLRCRIGYEYLKAKPM